MKYNIRLHNRYTAKTFDETVDLGELKFCVDNEFDNGKFKVCDLWTVVENSSSPENLKLLEQFETLCNSVTYELPFDITVVSMWNIEFLDGKCPEFISEDEMNKKLNPVKDNAVWVDLLIPDMFITSVYKLIYVRTPGDIVLAEIPYKSLSGNEIRFKSLNYSHGCKLNVAQEHVEHFSDHRITKLLTGEEAHVIWSTLVEDVLRHSGFNPEKANHLYNFNRFADEYKDVVDMVMNPEKYLKKKGDEKENITE